MSISNAIAYLKRTEQAPTESDEITLSHEDSPAHIDFSGELICCYLLDSGDHFEYVSNRDLTENAESLANLDQIGRKNLAKLADEGLQVREYGNIFVALLGGNFEASLLLAPEVWDESYTHVIENDFVAAIPARDILAFCDSASKSGIRELRETISRVWPSDDHLLTDRLYRRVDRRWVIYDA